MNELMIVFYIGDYYNEIFIKTDKKTIKPIQRLGYLFNKPREVVEMRLLLVEDDTKIALFVSSGLKEAGFAVDHMINGEDGLHMALNEPYDVIVMDLMLPKIDGLSFAAVNPSGATSIMNEFSSLL